MAGLRLVSIMISAVVIYILLHTFFRYIKLRRLNLRGFVVILSIMLIGVVWCSSDILCSYFPGDSIVSRIFGYLYYSMYILFCTAVTHFIFRISMKKTRINSIIMALLYLFPAVLMAAALVPSLKERVFVITDMFPGGFGYVMTLGGLTNLWRICHTAATIAALILAVRFELLLPQNSRNPRWVMVVASVLSVIVCILSYAPQFREYGFVMTLSLLFIPALSRCFYGYLFTARSAALEDAQEMFVVFDIYGKCVDANESARELFKKNLGTDRPNYRQVSMMVKNDSGEELDSHIFEIYDELEGEPRYYKMKSVSAGDEFSRFAGRGYVMQEVTMLIRQLQRLKIQPGV